MQPERHPHEGICANFHCSLLDNQQAGPAEESVKIGPNLKCIEAWLSSFFRVSTAS